LAGRFALQFYRNGHFNGFVNVSNEDISEFLKENDSKNTARKTSQDVACVICNKQIIKNDIRLLTCNNLYLSAADA